jgi:hypothetical protein
VGHEAAWPKFFHVLRDAFRHILGPLGHIFKTGRVFRRVVVATPAAFARAVRLLGRRFACVQRFDQTLGFIDTDFFVGEHL